MAASSNVNRRRGEPSSTCRCPLIAATMSFFFFKQKTAYEIIGVTGVQTCALPICKAYRCYATPAELTAMREKARAEGRTRLYDGLWRDRDASEAPDGMKPTIRLKAP